MALKCFLSGVLVFICIQVVTSKHHPAHKSYHQKQHGLNHIHKDHWEHKKHPDKTHQTGRVAQMRFLLAVNDTWADPPGCIATVATPFLRPNVTYNETQQIHVGNCDQGPLWFDVSAASDGKNKVSMLFHSSVIEDASPPTCDIIWDGGYAVPKRGGPGDSLLPGCFTMESREGYHMTAYWFYILDWSWA